MDFHSEWSQDRSNLPGWVVRAVSELELELLVESRPKLGMPRCF